MGLRDRRKSVLSNFSARSEQYGDEAEQDCARDSRYPAPERGGHLFQQRQEHGSGVTPAALNANPTSVIFTVSGLNA
jgi:hypothetical protein